MKNKQLFLNICLFCFVFLFSVIMMEIGLRVYLNCYSNEDFFLTYASLEQLQGKYKDSYEASRKFVPHRYLGYSPNPNYRKGLNKHNSLGYRGDEIILPKPKGEFRVVCLGGSTTYTGKIEDYHFSYPYLLEKELNSRGLKNVTVVNAGASGWSSWETLINFETRVLDLEPDMVIIYHGINDVHPRLVWPPEAYKGDNSGRRIANYSTVAVPNVFEFSTLCRFFMIRFGIIDSPSAMSRTISRAPSTFYGDDFQTQMLKGTYPYGIFKQVSAYDMLRANSPKYFARNIENIIIIAKERGVGVILATFASAPIFKEEPRVSSPEYIGAYKEMNKLLKTIAKKMGTDLFDFAEVFPEERQFYTDGRHVSIQGSKLKAKMFADHMIKANMLPGI